MVYVRAFLLIMCRIYYMDLSIVKEIKAEKEGVEKARREQLRKDREWWREG